MFNNCCIILLFIIQIYSKEECNNDYSKTMYNKEDNEMLNLIQQSVEQYVPCQFKNCSCFSETIVRDLSVFGKGIKKDMLKAAVSKGTLFKIIKGKLYRSGDCMFPARCTGVEYFLSKLKKELPDLELVLNTRDWPQVMKYQQEYLPVFSFSKTEDYWDIMYPAWAFWAGGPAIKLYPRGLGDWDNFRLLLDKTREKIPWVKKKSIAFFRGSRTHIERDPLVLLSREDPSIADAAYTKNQAWKSNKDTLSEAPAEEVSLEDHCKYKYLFNFRGVAASFRFKYLFLCQSLVFNVGNEWVEFFYPALKPWVHYVPIKAGAKKHEIRNILNFFKNHDGLAQEIAKRGRDVIWEHLRNRDVLCYWKLLLKSYAKLLKFKPKLDGTETEITN